jgi:uncharacterized membrane protein YheB (UPF0754 family)
MNKSLLTNLCAAVIFLAGFLFDQPIILSIGLFALSGALTNWLAIYMLFEKVPGLYGSGVIPSHFQEFRRGIHNLMMSQFFTDENIQRFLSRDSDSGETINLAPVIEKIDLSPAFDALVQTVEESSFGSMLSMVGGTKALEPLKPVFIEKMRSSLVNLTESDDFRATLAETIKSSIADHSIRDHIEEIIEQRLKELSPQLVKEIVQEMIRKHLGWLVVWGGVFGGLIGLLAAFM